MLHFSGLPSEPAEKPKPASPAPSPPLPSTAHFPPPLMQVAPTSVEKMEEILVSEPRMIDEYPIPDTVKPVTTPDLHGAQASMNISIDQDENLTANALNTLRNEGIISEIESSILSMNGLIDAADKAAQYCQEAIKSHNTLVEKVLEKAVGDADDADDGTWKDVFDAANTKSVQLERAQVSCI